MKYNKTRTLHYLWKTIRNGYLVNLVCSITMGAHLTSAISAMVLGSFFIPPQNAQSRFRTQTRMILKYPENPYPTQFDTTYLECLDGRP